MLKRKIFLIASALTTMAPTVPVLAQDRAAGGLEEVIVTARKRQESILKVPVVENVVTAETLEKYQISDLNDLSTRVPGLSMGAAVLSIGPQISIRGVGTSTLDAGVDQSVALNIDGLSLSQGLAYRAGLFDLQQAEVLKGPQALFFGKNSPGGVIALRTADPGSELEIIARAGYEFESREQRGEFIFSTPMSDTLGVRLAAMLSDSDGYFKNRATTQPGFGGQEPKPDRNSATRSNILRGTVVWQPSDSFDARLKLTYASDDVQGDASQGQLGSCPDGVGGYIPNGPLFADPNDDCKIDRITYNTHLDPAAFPGIRNNGRPFLDMIQKFGTLELNYRPTTDLTLTSLTGAYRVDADTMINGTNSGYAASAIYADNRFFREDFTQELRIDSQFASPVNFTAGTFFQDGRIFNRIVLGGNQTLGLPVVLRTGSHQIDIKSWSIFAQLRWRPIDTLEVAIGDRWTDETRSDTAYNLITGTPELTPVAVPQISSSNHSPELTLTYTPTDDLTLFGSVKRGYKSGSFTITTPVQPNINNSFGDEKVEGGELGLKSRLLDRSLALNLAGYYYVYKGLQVGTNEPAQGGLPIIRTINAGEAEIYGVDFDALYRPANLPQLTLNAAINWNHARFTKLRNVPCWGGQTIALGCDAVPNPTTLDPDTGLPLFTAQSSLDGLRLVRAPDWQITAGFSYEIPVSDAMNLTLGVDGLYTSKYPTALNDRDDAVQEGVTFVNASLTASAPDNRWEVALIGNNLTNKVTTGSCTTLNYTGGQVLPGARSGGVAPGAAGIDELTCVARPGREVWARITVRPAAFVK